MERKLHECKRCNHRWLSSLEHPKECPNRRCHSTYWAKPRVRRGIVTAFEKQLAEA